MIILKWKKALALALAASVLLLSGCEKKQAAAAEGKIGGTIIVLTNRTDVVDIKFQEYKEAFEQKYPGTNVEFEAITDYEGTVRTRMSTNEYGDVLCKPGIQTIDYPRYFEPLGSIQEFNEKFNFTQGSNAIDYQGTAYAYPVMGVVGGGIVYNKKVFKKAGITKTPRNTEEFYTALQAIKDKTDAVPIFMNYPAGWTLVQWEGGVTAFTDDTDYKNKMVHQSEPFQKGTAHYELYKLMYEVVKRGFCERDMLASDWEMSKQELADGKIGCMVLGSWAITQIKNLASNPDDIGYMPMVAEVNGKKYAEASLDTPLCINVHSKNKATARAWIEFLVHETDWVEFNESIPAVKGGKYPSVLDSFNELGVTYFEMNKPPVGEEGLYDTLDKESEIGFWSDPEKKRIVDAAMGTTNETFEQIMDDWNKRWSKARKNRNIN